MLTDEQKTEAERLYILSKLSTEEIIHAQRIEEAKRVMDEAERTYLNLQTACSHPLIAREYVNHGSTGGWDRGSDLHWTEHRCKLCDKRWQTNQRWKHLGRGLGLPDDTDAKM